MSRLADDVAVAPFGLAAGLLDDIDVYTAEGVEVGDVDSVLAAMEPGVATHVAVDMDDDAGFGDRDVVIPIEALTLDADRLILSLTPEDVARLPRWDD